MHRTHSLSRRRLLLGAAGAVALAARPRLGPGELRLFNSAEAWYLAAIALVVQAAGLFVRSGNGLGAMLDSLVNLTEESIRLSQNLLLRVAEVQAALDTLPDRVRVVLIENDQYRIRHETDSITSNLAFVDYRLHDDKSALKAADVRTKLKQCVAWGGKLAGAQAVPYGVGPIGALCAPVVAASVAKAHTLLGEREAVRAEMATKFVPWLVRAQDPKAPGSVMNLYLQEADRLKELTAGTKERIPPRVRDRLGPLLDTLTRLEAGEKVNAPIACVSYMQAIGHKQGKCLKGICDGYDDTGPIRTPTSLKTAPGRLLPISSESTMLVRCRCARYEDIIIYGEGEKQGLVLSAENDTTLETGPSLTVKTNWQALKEGDARPGGTCDPAAYGLPLDAKGEIDAVLESPNASAWNEETLALVEHGTKPIVQSREIIWSYFNILQSTREAEQRMRRVFSL